MKFPYTVVTDSESLQKGSVSDFSQETAYFAMMPKIPWTHRYKFTPKFNCHFHRIPCKTNHRQCTVFNATGTKRNQKLPKSKVLFSIKEKHGGVIAEIIEVYTYFPQGRFVMDPFAGKCQLEFVVFLPSVSAS